MDSLELDVDAADVLDLIGAGAFEAVDGTSAATDGVGFAEETVEGGICATTGCFRARIAGERIATEGTNCCKKNFKEICDETPLETRVSNMESAPCPKINDGAVLYNALANGRPGAETMSSIGLPADADPLV